MSDNTRKAPDEGPNGIDRWTSNGYGLRLNGKKVVPISQSNIDHKESEIDEIDEIEEK